MAKQAVKDETESGADMELSKDATAAAWSVLRSTQVQGRVDARLNRACTTKLKASCMKQDKKDEHQFEFSGGKLVLSDAEFDYLQKVFDVRIKAGVKGEESGAYADLADALESVPEIK